jgi:hypothetical protein
MTPSWDSSSPKTASKYAISIDATYTVGGMSIAVPAGFEFDGASIPPLAWPIIGSPFDPRFVRAALLHDWIYSSHLMPRKEADIAFRDILLADGVGDWRAELMYRAVRLAGVASWPDSPEDVAYMAWLRDSIIASGRSLETYWLHA